MGKIFENKLILAGVIILVVIFSISLRKTRLKTEYSAKVLEQKEHSLAKLEKEVAKLEENNRQLDDEFVKEKIIRDELLMKKPNEVVLQLPPESKKIAPSATPTPTPDNILKWKQVVF